MPEGNSIVLKYFPSLSQEQISQFAQLGSLYKDWNSKINVVSRKDVDELYLRHVLHSLAIAKLIGFKPATTVLDIGTGGGFPGVPLAIVFPHCRFHLVDSIGKKIKVVNEVVAGLKLANVTTAHIRAEEINKQFDFIVNRAVAPLETLMFWAKGKIKKQGNNELPNGLISLKGGNLTEEIINAEAKAKVVHISDYFSEPFFETKQIVHVAM
jgi:16S rRNA (guanine527-N7)-methyltransferase